MKKVFNKDTVVPWLTVISPILVYVILKYYYPGLLGYDNLLSSLEKIYSQYGPLIIFVAGVSESVYFINLFVPGSAAILLGAVLAASGVISLPAVILLGTAGLLIGYMFNWLVGRIGWFKLLKDFKTFKAVEEAEKRMKKQEALVIFLSGFHPNVASFTSLASGMMAMKFKKALVYFGLMQLFWSTFWGILFYIYGAVMLKNAVISTVIAFIVIGLIYFTYTKIEQLVKTK